MPRFLLPLAFLVACGGGEKKAEAPAPEPEPAAATPAPEKSAETTKYASMFGVLPDRSDADAPATQEQIALGRMLYYDARLSKSGEISCNSCHDLSNFGVDNEPTSPGHEGQRGARNSPTSYNAGLHIAQFWDGRAADLAAQAGGPILNPGEMAMPDEATVIALLSDIAGYQTAFAAAFPDDETPITYDNLTKAIGGFEAGLVTRDAFDRFQQGDASALTEQQQRGLETFVSSGCTACHSGAGLGGHMYNKLGLVNAYETPDKGRAEITGNEADAYFFKVPSLRNVAKTAPYFHDGSVATLEEAVRLMGWHQLGRELTDEQIADIVAFLGALTGEPNADYIAQPKMP